MKLIAAVVLVAAAASTAAAQRGASQPAESLADQDCKRAKAAGKQCVLSMEGEDVEGGVGGPDGVIGTGREFTKFSSLIRLRADFRVELIRAAEDL
jgi:hypothetical protein